MLDWIARKLGYERHSDESPKGLNVNVDSARMWDAAQTDRLNSAHWARVPTTTINDSLFGNLDTLQRRTRFEVESNATLDGIITTHACDLVGAGGPVLAIQGDDEAWGNAVEKLWRKWWANPDLHGQLSGPAILKLADRLLFTCGEFIVQLVSANAIGPVKLRLKMIGPERLQTPIGRASDPAIVLGVRLDSTGKPIEYYIDDRPVAVNSTRLSTAQPIPAKDIVHYFERREPDQVRGVPRFASILQVAADLRDYEAQVLDCMRQAAAQGIILKSNHPSARFVNLNATTKMERGTMRTVPPGWEPFHVKPEQPSTKYIEHLDEQNRKLGRVVNMPLMKIKLDSSNHNYSSARFDAQSYSIGLSEQQGNLERVFLNRILREIVRESTAAGVIPQAPEEWSPIWTWPTLPHVDALKEARGLAILLSNDLISYDEAVRRANNSGITGEEVLIAKARIAKLREALGLPEEQFNTGGGLADNTDNANDNGTPSRVDPLGLMTRIAG